MFSEKTIAFLLAACLTAILFSSTSHALYFTLQLKNGNEIITDHYTEDSNAVIHFYTNEGAVAIPKSTIKSIKSNDGSVAIDMEDELKKAATKTLMDESPEGEPVAEPKESETGKDQVNSINDQLFVINANLENLAKNKNIFLSQQEQFQQQRQKSQEHIAALKKEIARNELGNKDVLELEETKVKDLDSKLIDLEQRIKNSDQILEAQQRIKQRFEADLAKLQKQKQ